MRRKKMSNLKPRRPSLGTILGMTALVVAVVGTANAASPQVIIKRGDIAPGAVTANTIAKGAVKADKIAKGAVGSKAIGKGAVKAAALAKGSVGTAALASNAVTSGKLAPGSVYGGALGTISVHTTPIADLDKIAHNNEWTASNTEAVLCGPGEELLGTGFAFTSTGTTGSNEVAWLQALPVINGGNVGVLGSFESDAGGAAAGEVAAICLK
jgi:hypothetical protein